MFMNGTEVDFQSMNLLCPHDTPRRYLALAGKHVNLMVNFSVMIVISIVLYNYGYFTISFGSSLLLLLLLLLY